MQQSPIRLLAPRQPGCLETEHLGLMYQAPTTAKDPRLCAPPSPVVCLDGRCFSYSMLIQQVVGGLAEGTERQDTGNARDMSSGKYSKKYIPLREKNSREEFRTSFASILNMQFGNSRPERP